MTGLTKSPPGRLATWDDVLKSGTCRGTIARMYVVSSIIAERVD
jgi:hypothetical protein